jgi:hypothetical protein
MTGAECHKTATLLLVLSTFDYRPILQKKNIALHFGNYICSHQWGFTPSKGTSSVSTFHLKTGADLTAET